MIIFYNPKLSEPWRAFDERVLPEKPKPNLTSLSNEAKRERYNEALAIAKKNSMPITNIDIFVQWMDDEPIYEDDMYKWPYTAREHEGKIILGI